MTTSTVAPEIVAFARAVREALADLPADEVDDLTEGLEADLAESLSEDLRRALPEPVAYAAELRAAAGLPAPGVEKTSRLRDTVGHVRRELDDAWRQRPALVAVARLLAELRPVWWVARAWVVTWMGAAFFGMERGYGFDGAWWLVLVALVVVSVQWSRGLWTGPGGASLVRVVDVVAVVALLPVLGAASAWGDPGDYGSGYEDGVAAATNDDGSGGLTMGGRAIKNVFAYDAAGQPLTGVQLFDETGRPLDPFGLSSDDGRPCGDEDCTSLVVPAQLVTGQTAYNVFPLGLVAGDWDDELGETVPMAGAVASVPAAPFLQVPAVQPAPVAAPTTSQPVAPPNE